MFSVMMQKKRFLLVLVLCLLLITNIILFTQGLSIFYDFIQPKFRTPLYTMRPLGQINEIYNSCLEVKSQAPETDTDNQIFCYKVKCTSLPDILDDKPSNRSSIFFHETSCKSYLKGRISINSRQACAVESAARMNPDMDVLLLFTSPGVVEQKGDESDKLLSALMQYENIKLRHVDFKRYAKGSPVEQLYLNGTIERSEYAMSHASDILRYLTLWKYGGIYLDLDIIVMESLKGYPPNFSGSESDENVAAGIMGFASSGWGHDLARKCLDDLRNHFNGSNWGYNGPGVITRLLKNLCGVNKAKEMESADCQGFKVFPESEFYAVPWEKWKMYFESSSTDEVFKMSENSSIIHVWNKHSKNTKIPLNSTVAYITYAKKFCPKVIEQCDQFF